MNLFSSTLFWALVVVVGIVVVVLFRRRGHVPRPTVTQPAPQPGPTEADAEYLDSSHIGGPLFDEQALDAARRKAARDAGSKTGPS